MACSAEPTVGDESVPVGFVRRHGRDEMLRLSADLLCRHGAITGPTGSGKSMAATGLVCAIKRAVPSLSVTLVDCKGETACAWGDVWFPALGLVKPEGVLRIAPFSGHAVKLNPLTPCGLEPEVQAHLLATLLSTLVADGFRQRMAGVLAKLGMVGIEVGGHLGDLIRLLEDSSFRTRLLPRVKSEKLRAFLTDGIDQEPQSSRDAVKARLEWMLLIPSVRAALCADGCLPSTALIDSPLTLIDVGTGVPQGFSALSRLLAAFLMQRVVGGVFARAATHPALVFVDEAHELVRVAPDDVMRMYTQARFRSVGIVCLTQSMQQLAAAGPGFIDCLRVNTAHLWAFAPEKSDIDYLLPLIPVTGSKRNPLVPDELLSPKEERDAIVARLRALPRGHALVGDFVARRTYEVRMPRLPVQEAQARAAKLAPDLRAAFARGYAAVPVQDILRRVDAVADAPAEQAAATSHTPAKTSRPGRRATLVLP